MRAGTSSILEEGRPLQVGSPTPSSGSAGLDQPGLFRLQVCSVPAWKVGRGLLPRDMQVQVGPGAALPGPRKW